jgi:hypothetical protein
MIKWKLTKRYIVEKKRLARSSPQPNMLEKQDKQDLELCMDVMKYLMVNCWKPRKEHLDKLENSED